MRHDNSSPPFDRNSLEVQVYRVQQIKVTSLCTKICVHRNLLLVVWLLYGWDTSHVMSDRCTMSNIWWNMYREPKAKSVSSLSMLGGIYFHLIHNSLSSSPCHTHTPSHQPLLLNFSLPCCIPLLLLNTVVQRSKFTGAPPSSPSSWVLVRLWRTALLKTVPQSCFLQPI